MSKINKILLGVVVVLVIALGVLIYWQMVGFETPYYAVYLTTGDLYFGKLNVFPSLSISDAYILQPTNDKQNPISINQFSKSFWGPKGTIDLNEKNVVWKAELSKDSQLITYMKNPQAAAQTEQPAQNQQIPSQLPTSTIKK